MKLRQLLPELWADCETRMITLSLLVRAIPKAQELTQPELASEMPVAAQETRLVQRQRRFLKNKQVDERAWYEPIITPFLQALSRTTIPLILDTTDAGVGSHLLTVAVGYQRRALPGVWQGGAGKRGHTKGETQVALLDETVPLLPPDSDGVLLGDGEFGHGPRLEWLAQRPGWNDCLRVAKDTCISYEGQWRRLDSFDLGPEETLWLAQVSLTPSAAFGPVNLLLTWDRKHDRLVPLVTHLDLPQEAPYWYLKRPWIEPLFGDVKGHGFDFQTARLRHPERLSRLMLAVALASLWLCFLGTVAILLGRRKQVDRTDRRDLSLFTIGRRWLNHLVKRDKPFLVGFLPYPFLAGLPPAGPSSGVG